VEPLLKASGMQRQREPSDALKTAMHHKGISSEAHLPSFSLHPISPSGCEPTNMCWACLKHKTLRRRQDASYLHVNSKPQAGPRFTMRPSETNASDSSTKKDALSPVLSAVQDASSLSNFQEFTCSITLARTMPQRSLKDRGGLQTMPFNCALVHICMGKTPSNPF
jgi:hypothetical protein